MDNPLLGMWNIKFGALGDRFDWTNRPLISQNYIIYSAIFLDEQLSWLLFFFIVFFYQSPRKKKF